MARRPMGSRPLRRSKEPPLSSAVRHFLQCRWTSSECFAPVRLRGWLDAGLLATLPDRLSATWKRHRLELIAEAISAGFRPFAENWFDDDGQLLTDIDDTPRDLDPRRETWSIEFCREHGY